MKQRTKENLFFLIIFLATVIVIFWDLIILGSGFINGDYAQQFFPWCKIYADSLRDFQLPLWAREGQGGFPLFAEGQIGALYPLNILLFRLLPFKIAYNYSFLLHFVLSGVFTYFFARKLKVDVWGSSLAATLLCFGSAYAGCFVNISALKVLTWFPFLLLLTEYYLEDKRAGWLLIMGLIVGFQHLAGSFQMAFYSVMFFSLYFILRNFSEKLGLFRILISLFIINVIALFISLPQLWFTCELSVFSNRASAGIGFALWNSFSPASISGVVFPSIGFLFSRGDIIYVGVLGLFFAFIATEYLRKEKSTKSLLVLFFFSLFLAFGGFNPLYTLLIKSFKFYVFRSPSRFIYFGVFVLSILSGKGFSFFIEKKQDVTERVYLVFIGLLVVVLMVFLSAKVVFILWGQKMLEYAKLYVQKNIYGAAHHRYSLETYMVNTESFYRSLVNSFSFQDPFALAGFVVIAFSIVILFIAMRSGNRRSYLKYLFLVVIVVDLLVFSLFSKGLRPDIADFKTIIPKEGKLVKILEDSGGIFRIMPFGDISRMPPWLKPSLNAYYGFDSVAFYSPLVLKNYYGAVRELGIVDDSLGIVPPAVSEFFLKLDLLRSLNVKYVFSSEKLDIPGLGFVVKENDTYLYELSGYLPRFFIAGKGQGSLPYIKVEDYRSGYARASLSSEQGGRLIFSESFYPGWKAFVDGEIVQIQPFRDILQSVEFGPGRHVVVFKFQPDYLEALLILQLTVFVFTLTLGLYNILTRKMVI